MAPGHVSKENSLHVDEDSETVAPVEREENAQVLHEVAFTHLDYLEDVTQSLDCVIDKE